MALSRLAPTDMRRRRWYFPSRLRSRSVLFWVVLVSLTLFLSYGWISPRLNWKDNGAERERGEITTEKEATRRLGRLYRLALSLDDSRHCTFVVGVRPIARGRDLQRLISWYGFSWLFWNRRVYYLQGLDVAALRSVQTAKPRSLRSDVVFSRIGSERAIDGVIGCAVSHLLALRSALLRGCETALFLEDDTSLGLIGLWDKPVADSIREYATQEYPVLQMELKLRSFLERGHSGALGLEKLPVRCSARHTVPHQFKVTYGTGAYGMSRIGMKRTLQRFIADDVHGMRYRAMYQKPVDVSKVIAAGGHADVYVILNSSTTKVLWPPYFHEEVDSKSLVRPSESTGNSHQPQHVASAKHAIKANLLWARACREYIMDAIV